MKYRVLLCFFAILGLAYCQNHPQLTARVCVKDDLGGLVEGATVSYTVHNRIHLPSTIETTGKDGLAKISDNSYERYLYYSVKKDGYYGTSGSKFTFEDPKLGFWQPRDPLIEMTIKRIIKPIPLIARSMVRGDGLKYTADRMGFDLEVSDWVAPHGKGVRSDLVIWGEGLRQTDLKWDEPWVAKLHVETGNPDDGLCLYEANASDMLCALRMPHQAPEAGYERKVIKRKAKELDPKDTSIDKDMLAYFDDTKPNENYFLRVRTVKDERGKIISAHYAKIYGGFQWGLGGGWLKFHYYFNPASNDRNLEFDPKRNLFKVPETENAVRAP